MIQTFRRLILTIVGCLAFASAAIAQNITLVSADGSVRLEGEFLDYDGQTYRIKSVFGNLSISALGVTCSGIACPDAGQYAADITVSGSTSVIDSLLPGLIEDFGFQSGQNTLRSNSDSQGWTYFISDSARVPVARLQARSVSSEDGFSELSAGIVDMIVSARGPTKAEIKTAKSTGTDDLTSPFASQILTIDGLIFVVSPRNPVSELTLDQISAIYAGEITNWAELGGADGSIQLLTRLETSELAKSFSKRFFTKSSGRKLAPSIPVILDEALTAILLRDPFAIGYTGFSGIKNAKAVAIRGDCGISQSATAFSLSAGDYPLARSFSLYLPRRRLPVFAQSFLAFLESESAQSTIAEYGFVGQGIFEAPLSAQQNRIADAIAFSGDEVSLADLKNFITEFSNAKRLSTTFRFKDGSAKIDARSRRDIQTLAQMIELGDFKGKKLIFAGFSDTDGSAAANRKISRQRAARVAKLVKAAATRADLGQVDIQTLGMGEVSPLACNGTKQGRKINRRVEVWVK